MEHDRIRQPFLVDSSVVATALMAHLLSPSALHLNHNMQRH